MPLGHYHQRRRHICGEDGEGAARCGGPGSAIQIPDLGEDGVYDNHLPRCVQHYYVVTSVKNPSAQDDSKSALSPSAGNNRIFRYPQAFEGTHTQLLFAGTRITRNSLPELRHGILHETTMAL